MPRLHSCAALALLLLLSGCAAHETIGPARGLPDSMEPWAEFSIRSMLARRITETTVQVGDLQSMEVGEEFEQWLRKTTRFFGGASRVQWTDTLSCGPARAVLSNMYALEMPRPIEGGSIEVRADGVRYTLSTDGEYGVGKDGEYESRGRARISISSLGGTPLADWAEQSLVELEACWTDLPPADRRLGPQPDRR